MAAVLLSILNLKKVTWKADPISTYLFIPVSEIKTQKIKTQKALTYLSIQFYT